MLSTDEIKKINLLVSEFFLEIEKELGKKMKDVSYHIQLNGKDVGIDLTFGIE